MYPDAGYEETFLVPAGVTIVNVQAIGDNGGRRSSIGYLRAGNGILRIPLTRGVKGGGTLIAYFLHGLSPFSVDSRVATFKEAGSVGACR